MRRCRTQRRLHVETDRHSIFRVVCMVDFGRYIPGGFAPLWVIFHNYLHARKHPLTHAYKYTDRYIDLSILSMERQTGKQIYKNETYLLAHACILSIPICVYWEANISVSVIQREQEKISPWEAATSCQWRDSKRRMKLHMWFICNISVLWWKR